MSSIQPFETTSWPFLPSSSTATQQHTTCRIASTLRRTRHPDDEKADGSGCFTLTSPVTTAPEHLLSVCKTSYCLPDTETSDRLPCRAGICGPRLGWSFILIFTFSDASTKTYKSTQHTSFRMSLAAGKITPRHHPISHSPRVNPSVTSRPPHPPAFAASPCPSACRTSRSSPSNHQTKTAGPSQTWATCWSAPGT